MTVVTRATIQASITWSQIDTPNASYDTSTVVDGGSVSYAKILSSGNGNSEIDNVWWDTTGTIASGNQDNYDFMSISRTIFDSTLSSNFTNIKSIIIENQSSGTDSLYITAVGSGLTALFGGANSGVIVPPLSPMMFVNYVSGWTVDISNRNLQIINQGTGTISYRMGVVGTKS